MVLSNFTYQIAHRLDRMKIRFSRLRIFLFTFTLGLAAASVSNWYLQEVYVRVPEVKSDTPIIIRLCPDEALGKGYWEDGYIYFSKEKAVNCVINSLGAS